MHRFVIVTIAGTAFATIIGPHGPLGGFWAPGPDAPHVHGAQLAAFLAENMLENLAFGAGLAVLLLGRGLFAGRAAWLAAVWLLASWMPHAALHLHIGMRPAALLPVEWIFHGGAIVAAGVLLAALVRPAASVRLTRSGSGTGRG